MIAPQALGFSALLLLCLLSPVALLAVAFDHADHRETPCADCHHNFVDGSGGGTCYNCHKYHPEIAAEMETMFHDFCFGCHVSRRQEGEDSGPMRECRGCHPG